MKLCSLPQQTHIVHCTRTMAVPCLATGLVPLQQSAQLLKAVKPGSDLLAPVIWVSLF